MLLNYSIRLCVKRLESSNEFINIMRRMKKIAIQIWISKRVLAEIYSIL